MGTCTPLHGIRRRPGKLCARPPFGTFQSFPHLIAPSLVPVCCDVSTPRREASCTLVVAPQGYGKSVLLAQWAATRADLGAFVSFDRVSGPREVVSVFVEPLAGLRPQLIDLPLLATEEDDTATDDELLGRLAGIFDSVRESVFVIDCFDELEPPSLRQDVLTLFA